MKEARVDPIAMVMRLRRMEWFEHVTRRGETENTRAGVEMKMEGKSSRGRTDVAMEMHCQKGH